MALNVPLLPQQQFRFKFEVVEFQFMGCKAITVRRDERIKRVGVDSFRRLLLTRRDLVLDFELQNQRSELYMGLCPDAVHQRGLISVRHVARQPQLAVDMLFLCKSQQGKLFAEPAAAKIHRKRPGNSY